MHTVVTGASGFIGRTLVPALLHHGHDVLGTDRQERPATVDAPHLVCELTTPDAALVGALERARAVVHLAGCPGVRDHRPGIAALRHRDNVAALDTVLRLTPAQTPLVVFSSSSVYGGTSGGRGCRETDPVRPLGGYALSKVAAEDLCRRRLRAGGRVLVVRPFTVCGQGQRPDMALSTWAAALRGGEPVTVFGSPERTRDITDVATIPRVVLGLLAGGHRGTVNLGSGVAHPLRELVAAVARAVGRPATLRVVAPDAAEVAHTRADTRRLARWAGTVPVTDLDDVVRRAVGAGSADETRSEPAGRRARGIPA